MQGLYFASGMATVGKKDVAFEMRDLRNGLRMYIPTDFVEDPNIVSNYMYFFSHDKSPLGIAIKFTKATDPAQVQKVVTHYFSQPVTEPIVTMDVNGCRVWYRETATNSRFMSVYSLRFCREIEGGVLSGCFNCASAYQDDWKTPVLEMLYSVEHS